jgi:hypothetical protein
LIGVVALLLLFAGDVITTVGTDPRLTVIVAALLPNALVHETLMVFAPVLSATELVVPPLDALPLTVQVVPPAIVAEPSTVYERLIELLVVFVLLAGDVMTTAGTTPRLTVIEAESVPYALVQATVMVFAPVFSETVFGLVDAVPLNVQVTGAVPVEDQSKLVELLVV